MKTHPKDIVPIDAKGRISLGKPAQGIIGYLKTVKPDGTILLKPMAAVPASELWIYQQPEVLVKIKRGLQQSLSGKTLSLGSFARYAKD